MNAISRIKELQEKQHKAQLAAAKVAAQIEAGEEALKKLEAALMDEFSVTVEDAPALLEKLKGEQNDLLEAAEEVLGKINL